MKQTMTEHHPAPPDPATMVTEGMPPESGPQPSDPVLDASALRALVAHLPGAAVFVVDHGLRYVLAEGEALRAAGFASADLVGKTIFEALDRTLATAYEPMYRRALDGREFVHEHEAHARVYVSRGVPLRDGSGIVYAALVVSYDITDRRRAEAELRVSEERLRLAVAATGLGIFDWDLTTDQVAVNARFREMLGLAPGDGVIGAAMLGGVVHPEDRAFVEARLGEAFDPRSPGSYEFEHRAVTPRGEIWLLTFGQVYFAGEGAERRAVRVVGNDLDITARKRAEDAVRASDGRHRFLLALNDRLLPLADPEAIQREAMRLLGEHLGASRVGYAEILPDGETSLVTRNYAVGVTGIEGRHRVTDYSPSLLAELTAGRTVVRGDVANDPRLTAAEQAAHAALDIGAAVDIPLVKAGRLAATMFVHFREAHAWTQDELALVTAVAARTWDAVERTRAEAALVDAKETAEAANRAKGEFLAVMSHELRTPLNAIGGYTELMELGLRGPVTEQQRVDLARIQQSQRHLLGLINQVLNYTRVDAGAIRYDIATVRVADALAASEALIVPQVRARSLTYVLGHCATELAVRADREKLQQILLNLLSNAVKFTEPGGEVRVHCEAREETVAISVADTGVGIATEKLASVFEPFVQVDQRLTRTHEGVGLGLAISRDLARGMGGDLTAESAPGAGSTFTLVLPRA